MIGWKWLFTGCRKLSRTARIGIYVVDVIPTKMPRISHTRSRPQGLLITAVSVFTLADPGRGSDNVPAIGFVSGTYCKGPKNLLYSEYDKSLKGLQRKPRRETIP
jgi:hypothetical protein